jgi:Pyruvate/2-oxoacid:ferredoxin oxidoreductase delta subunit
MKISPTEISGRPRVIPDGDSTTTLRADHIVTAIGAEPEITWQVPSGGNTRDMVLSHCKLVDGDKPVIYGGDLTNRVKSIADAIASGKQAAIALDTFFKKGWSSIEKDIAACRVGPGPALSMAMYLRKARQSRNPHIVKYPEINSDYFQPQPRVSPVTQPPETRVRSFAEIEASFSADAAAQEFDRCFNCGLCNACDYCRLYCPEMAVIADAAERWIHMDYCKGCGICVTECPRNAMAMEEEDK